MPATEVCSSLQLVDWVDLKKSGTFDGNGWAGTSSALTVAGLGSSYYEVV